MTIGKHATEFAGKTIITYDPATGITDPVTEVYRIAIGDDDDSVSSWLETFTTFVNDPKTSEVTALVAGLWSIPTEQSDAEQVVEAIATARDKLPVLTGIFLGDITYEESEISWIWQTDVSPLLRAYPRLEHFRVRGGNGLKLGVLQHDHLRSLIIETGGLDRSVVHDIWRSQLPELEHLEIWTGAEWYGANTMAEDFAPLLSGNLFPKLRYLGLRDCQYVDDLASLLTVSPLLDRIRVLDLSLGTLSQRGAEALLACPAIGRLEALDIHHHYCPDEIIERFKALPIEVDVSGQDESGIDDEEERFVAVSE